MYARPSGVKKKNVNIYKHLINNDCPRSQRHFGNSVQMETYADLFLLNFGAEPFFIIFYYFFFFYFLLIFKARLLFKSPYLS